MDTRHSEPPEDDGWQALCPQTWRSGEKPSCNLKKMKEYECWRRQVFILLTTRLHQWQSEQISLSAVGYVYTSKENKVKPWAVADDCSKSSIVCMVSAIALAISTNIFQIISACELGDSTKQGSIWISSLAAATLLCWENESCNHAVRLTSNSDYSLGSPDTADNYMWLCSWIHWCLL